jgi:hypothetical protein
VEMEDGEENELFEGAEVGQCGCSKR